jgi:hypothetical protein
VVICSLGYFIFPSKKVLGVIFLVLLDHLLFLFSVIPIRLLLFVPLGIIQGRLSRRRIYDVLKLGTIVVTTLLMSRYLDFGVFYHNIKAQSTIKIYVIVNVLEVVDKIFSCFGNEIFNLLKESVLKCCSKSFSLWEILQCCVFVLMALVYSMLHAVVLFIQWVTLSVAINFNNSALVTVLISNNFMELKSQVFKRVSPENLVQLTYGDGVERLQLFVFLFLITVHNLLDIGIPALVHAGTYLVLVLGSEIAVDWFKHGFVIKFNSLSASYYSDGLALVVRDALNPENDSCTNLQNAAQRVGFVDVPFAAIVLKLIFESKALNTPGMIVLFVLGLWVCRTIVHLVIMLIGHCRKRSKRVLFARKGSTRDLDSLIQRNSAAVPPKEKVN